LREARWRALDVDHLDEVWEGVLHMSPPPHGLHGECLGWISMVLRLQATRHGFGRVSIEAGVRRPGSGRSDDRVPDVSLLPPGYEYVDGWVEDSALLVVEVRSPREEVLQKLDFYAERGVAEVLHIDYRERRAEVFRREGKSFMAVTSDRDGCSEVRTAPLRIRRVERESGAVLEVVDARGGGEMAGW